MIRRETDSFGSVDVPKEALYGIQTVRCMENLSFSRKKLSDYPAYIQALSMVKKAAALTNGRVGEIPIPIQEAIVTACNELIRGAHLQHFPIDPYHGGGGIGTNMNVNEVIANLANTYFGYERGTYEPVSPNHVNASQSTSDVCHTAIRLTIAQQLEAFVQLLRTLQGTMKEKAERWLQISTISRTCLQDGMRVQLGDSLYGVVAMLDRRITSLNHSIKQMHVINLGGTVIGSGVGASIDYRENILVQLKKVTGKPVTHRSNLYDAAQHVDDLGDVSNELKQLANGFIKVAKDLRLRSSGPEAGFGELNLPAVQAGSSFFPGKVNPVLPETLLHCCFKVLGHDRTVQAVLEHGELDLNVFEGAAGMAILDAISLMEKMLPVFQESCLKGMTANEKHCKALSETTVPLVVDLKEKFGYQIVSDALKTNGTEGLRQLQTNGGDFR
ncbi:lyase family protein [Guptibacillus hwajinpoensis]|uniref:lyase family protein n=1 Tax=Guptibacillus hwajinpoensis TaxID=208199 RepID=UPI001CD72B7F|nr:lyase family protein [Pseudalkalibacillus hwajinpoensis]MCA0989713.1 aspartate ammonia-lyase [Pseudalkalibacillus hwajinpoensis]